MKQVVLVLTLITATYLAGLAAVEAYSGAETQAYTAYTLHKPADLSSLEEWVTSNYTDHLLQGTLKSTTVGDFNAVSFSTRGENGLEFNLLFDNGAALVLLTTARLTQMAADLDAEIEVPLSKAASCDTATNRCNCVFYARCKVPALPYGLTYYSDKVKIINSYSASVGSVAIMNVGAPYGHVAVVTAVKKDIRTRKVTSITVTEANYKSCQITTRSGSPESLKVVGYFKP